MHLKHFSHTFISIVIEIRKYKKKNYSLDLYLIKVNKKIKFEEQNYFFLFVL